MTAPDLGVLPVFGPLDVTPQAPVRGPYRCGCDHTRGLSCNYCDGQAQDEWQIELAAREAEKERARLMRNPAYRAQWLGTFDEPLRSLMAADADRRYGPTPTPATDQRRTA